MKQKELEEQIKKHEEIGKQIEEMRVQLNQIDLVKNLIAEAISEKKSVEELLVMLNEHGFKIDEQGNRGDAK